jgi:hypothetical protein
MAGSPIIGVSILWCFSGIFWASRRRPGGSYKGDMMRENEKKEREKERDQPVKNPSVFKSNRSCVRMMIARRFFLFKSDILSISHALFTPTFPYGSSREIVVDYVEKLMMAYQFFTLLQPGMRTNGAISG